MLRFIQIEFLKSSKITEAHDLIQKMDIVPESTYGWEKDAYFEIIIMFREYGQVKNAEKLINRIIDPDIKAKARELLN